jgi:hypothetical protein
MFASLQNRTYFLFAGLNLPWIPIVCFVYPETANRSLESIDTMFSTKNLLYSKMEAAYNAAGNGDVLAARAQSISQVVDKVVDDNSVSHSESV